jgi:hypothetical protein
LRRFTIELPTQRDLDSVLGRLEHAGVRVSEFNGGFAATDPSANPVHFKVREPAL